MAYRRQLVNVLLLMLNVSILNTSIIYDRRFELLENFSPYVKLLPVTAGGGEKFSTYKLYPLIIYIYTRHKTNNVAALHVCYNKFQLPVVWIKSL